MLRSGPENLHAIEIKSQLEGYVPKAFDLSACLLPIMELSSDFHLL